MQVEIDVNDVCRVTDTYEGATMGDEEILQRFFQHGSEYSQRVNDIAVHCAPMTDFRVIDIMAVLSVVEDVLLEHGVIDGEKFGGEKVFAPAAGGHS